MNLLKVFTMPSVQLDNIQSLMLAPFGMRWSRHLFCSMPSTESAKTFISRLMGSLAFGHGTGQSRVANLSLTVQGLKRLCPGIDVDQLDPAFASGPNPTELGDWPATASAESEWWEKQFISTQVDCIVHLHAQTSAELMDSSFAVQQLAAESGVVEMIPRRSGARLDGFAFSGTKLHFGYVDGLSKLDIAWDEGQNDQTVSFRNFVLGYSSREVQSSPASGPIAELLSDSSYLVFRWIYQDVAEFNQFLRRNGPLLYPELVGKTFPGLTASAPEERLAAKMMGRWRDGTPLVLSPEKPEPSFGTLEFNYSRDLDGRHCPLSAHIRVVNPRDQKLSALAAVEGVPRVLRRGMPYGPELSGYEDDGIDRGVIGLFLCSSIRHQFIKLMKWINRNDFTDDYPPAGNRQDAIAGNRGVYGASKLFDVPHVTATSTIVLADFLRTKGTLYCLLPSRSSLLKLSR